jgi:hypothetical protein
VKIVGIDHILDRLSGLGEVTARPLFGGNGIYWRDTIFAIAFGGGMDPAMHAGPIAAFFDLGVKPISALPPVAGLSRHATVYDQPRR